ncbi:MAG: acyl-CoA dehydrogenase family protein [Gammaproteobacteria bacterium]|nr:acyl-CoA dehydrogenase family protein [Gammaproteobacteria bacterium]
MDFEFSEEQLQLVDSVNRWVEKTYTPQVRKTILEQGGFSKNRYQQMADLGLTGLLLPESVGGLGMSSIEAMVVMEQLGRGLVLEPLASSWLVGCLLERSADLSHWGEKLASGHAIGGVAFQETRHTLSACQTQAKLIDGRYYIEGKKCLVESAEHAHILLVSALLGSEVRIFVVETSQTGLNFKHFQTIDGGRASDVHFSSVLATPLAISADFAFDLAQSLALAWLCAQAVGILDKIFQITTEYLNTRKQFGVNLASFQALRHRVADMKLQLELARSMSYYASLSLLPWRTLSASELKNLGLVTSQAKYQLGQAMRYIGQQSIQMHGGIGMTDEYILGQYFKRITQMEILWGDSFYHLDKLSSHLEDLHYVGS